MPSAENDAHPARNPEADCPRCGWRSRAAWPTLCPACGYPPRFTPIRVCCGQPHHGPVCPDGLVMCQLCFKRVTRNRLHMLEEGDGLEPSSAPIYEDVCATCKRREDAWGTRVIPPDRG